MLYRTIQRTHMSLFPHWRCGSRLLYYTNGRLYLLLLHMRKTRLRHPSLFPIDDTVMAWRGVTFLLQLTALEFPGSVPHYYHRHPKQQQQHWHLGLPGGSLPRSGKQWTSRPYR